MLIFDGVFRSDNLLNFEHLLRIDQSRISHFQALNTLRKLEIQGRCPWTLQGGLQHLMDPSCIENILYKLVTREQIYVSPNSIKMSSSRLGTIGLFLVCFEWVTKINRLFMLKVISLALLFLIRLRFPLNKSVTFALWSRYGNLVVKELRNLRRLIKPYENAS